MLIEVSSGIPENELKLIIEHLAGHEDVRAWPVRLSGRLFVAVSGDEALVPPVDSPVVIGAWSTTERGYRLVARESGIAPGVVKIGSSSVGGGSFWAAAGPCALESFEDALATAEVLAAAGADAIRMGLFKPRSSPYHFQGKGRQGLRMLAEIRAAVGLPVVTEVLDPRDVGVVAEVADCLQVDTRNMGNRALLAELGAIDRPVLLMRGLRSSVTDWLRAAEYVMSRGNPNIVLCARGVVSFDDSLTFQPDYGAILAVRRHTELPVIFDPSHSTGRLDAVAPAALAAAVFGVDGLLIESHLAPERMHRPGDADQMYRPERIADLLRGCQEARGVASSLLA